jgi:hypothetical protein
MFPYEKKKKKMNVMTLGTVVPAPADEGLNLDDRG